MKTILITGAGRGIGFALTEAYLVQGHRVIATYRSKHAEQVLAALAHKGDLTTIELEVSSTDSITTFAAQLRGQTIDVLINNAGVFGGEQQSINNLNFADWKQTLAINALAPIEVTLALLPNLRMAENAKVIAISSMMASFERDQPNYYAYRSSKAALNKAMQCLAHDLKAEGMVVCPLHPGWVQTDMGGAAADITVEECVNGLIPLIDRLTTNDSGKFFQFNGDTIAW